MPLDTGKYGHGVTDFTTIRNMLKLSDVSVVITKGVTGGTYDGSWRAVIELPADEERAGRLRYRYGNPPSAP